MKQATTVGDPLLVDTAHATDVSLCGGKAAGLATLRRAGFAVPDTVCLTTGFYRRWLEVAGLRARLAGGVADAVARPHHRSDVLATMRVWIETAGLSDDLTGLLRLQTRRLTRAGERLAVRSSAPYEDHADASHAGIHTSATVDADDEEALASAIKACWASLWTDAAWMYRERVGLPHAQAAMAVLVQRFVAGDWAGVGFSADPLTGDPLTVAIEAGRTDEASVVSGRLTPDLYHVTLSADGQPSRVHRRAGPSRNASRRHDRPGKPTRNGRGQPELAESRVLELAQLVKAVERACDTPSDVEWVFDGRTFWAVQARPITAFAASRPGAPAPTLWTRANLKEVFPELPSPLALSYLGVTLNVMSRTYHAAQGHALSPGTELVAVFQGRPYLNLSLMQQQTVERGGDPAIVSRLFGGVPVPARLAPRPGALRRVSTANRVRLVREMLATFFRTPYRGRRLFGKVRRDADRLRRVRLERLDDGALLAHLGRFGARLLDERALRRLHEVISAQSRAYMALDQLLAAWIGVDADSLVKQLMTGLGTLPNVRMTYGLMRLGALAARDPRPRAFFAGEPGDSALRGWKAALAGTAFAAAFGTFLDEFGHRGPYESDVMSPRFAEDPAPLLRVIQLYVKAGAVEDPLRHEADRRRVRQAATDVVRAALRHGQGRVAFGLRWTVFSIMRGALQRLLALRDECRHVMTMMVAHLRQISLEIGRRATRQGVLASADDVFFLHWEELPRVLVDHQPDWRAIARGRRAEREQHAATDAPDLLVGSARLDDDAGAPGGDDLVGLGVSPGTVVGTVKILRAMTDVGHLSGEIVVVPAIEPTLTPIFPLIVGMIAEMGGLLSHAAILAREYGLPAVVSVPGATRRLRDGDRIELDGTTGRIRIVRPASPSPGGRRHAGLARQPHAAVREEVGRDNGANGGARQDVGDVVPLEVDASQRDGGREPVERPAQARIVRGEDGRHGEDGGRVTGGERVDLPHERGAGQRRRHRAARPRAADEVLEGELQQPGDGKGQRPEHGGVAQTRPADDPADQAQEQARHQQRHAGSNGVDGADEQIEGRALPLRGPARDVPVGPQRGDQDQQGHPQRG